MKKRLSKIMLAILFASVLTLLVVMTPLAKAQAQTLSLFPGEGPPGSSVTASISGFTPGTGIDLVWGSNLDIGTTTATGSDSITFTVPSSATAGTYTVTALGSGSAQAQATFSVVLYSGSTPTPAPTATPAPTPTLKPVQSSSGVAPTFAPTPTANSNNLFSPLLIGIIAVVIAAVAIMSVFMVTRGRGKRVPYQGEAGYEPRPTNPSQPQYAAPGSNQPPFGQPPPYSPYSSSRGSSPSPYGRPSASPYSSSRASSPSPYGRPSASSYSASRASAPTAYGQSSYSRGGQPSTYGGGGRSCPNCRRPVRDDQNVCPGCGKRLK